MSDIDVKRALITLSGMPQETVRRVATTAVNTIQALEKENEALRRQAEDMNMFLTKMRYDITRKING